MPSKKWTEVEDYYLKGHSTDDVNAIAKTLGRSKASVQKRLSAINPPTVNPSSNSSSVEDLDKPANKSAEGNDTKDKKPLPKGAGYNLFGRRLKPDGTPDYDVGIVMATEASSMLGDEARVENQSGIKGKFRDCVAKTR